MELISLENYQVDLVVTEAATATVVIIMDTRIGTDGEKLMDSCAEMIKTVTGSTNVFIAKTMN